LAIGESVNSFAHASWIFGEIILANVAH
jgi:hypothetical protein